MKRPLFRYYRRFLLLVLVVCAFFLSLQLPQISDKDKKSVEEYSNKLMQYYRSNQSKKLSESQKKSLLNLVETAKKEAPTSFAAFYLEYLNGRHNTDKVNLLKNAAAIESNYPSMHEQFMAYYEITGDSRKRAEYAKKLMESGLVSRNQLEYNRNLLNALPQNAVLFTHGFADTYPVWILQDVKGVRKDVQLVAFDLLYNEKYRARTEKLLGVKIKHGFEDREKEYIVTALTQTSKTVCIGLTYPKAYFKSIGTENLYAIGNVYRYNRTPLDNIGMIKSTWKGMDKKEMYTARSSSDIKLNNNYLLPLMVWYRNMDTRDPDREEIRVSIEKIAKRGGVYDKLGL